LEEKKDKKRARKPSGFINPTLIISDELANFLGKPVGTLMARTEVTRDINGYIRSNMLQDRSNGRKINPDHKLSSLLKIPYGEELTYFNIQRFLSPHFNNVIQSQKRALPIPPPPPYVSIEQEPIFENSMMDTPQRRRPLPASVRDSVWNHYIGEDINKHRCFCCKKVLISIRLFHVGHVISVRDGGTDEINNLRPICSPCNHSMGTTNMIEFVKTYGYYIG